MKLKAIHMSADRHARLKVLSQEAGFKTMAKFIESLLDAPAKKSRYDEETEIGAEVERRIEERIIINRHTTEDCAREMLNMLPESTRTFAYEVCENILHIQPSQLIHGHLMNAADSSLLQSPHIDPSWEQSKVEEKKGASTCEWPGCRQLFEPDHYGQRYCSNICGGKAATLMLPVSQVKTQPILDAPGMQNLIAV